MALFHADIRLPQGFVAPTGTVALEYSRHAIAECNRDRYGKIRQFGRISLSRFRVIEVETDDRTGKVVKLVIRGAYELGMDVVMAVNPRPGSWLVRTVWLNSSQDAHRTLDRGRYVA